MARHVSVPAVDVGLAAVCPCRGPFRETTSARARTSARVAAAGAPPGCLVAGRVGPRTPTRQRASNRRARDLESWLGHLPTGPVEGAHVADRRPTFTARSEMIAPAGAHTDDSKHAPGRTELCSRQGPQPHPLFHVPLTFCDPTDRLDPI